MIPIARSAQNLKRGVAVRFGVRRVCLIRSDSVFGAFTYCDKPGYVAAAARGLLCDRCVAEARRHGYDL